MGLFRKKNGRNPRQSVQNRSSAPVVRYYQKEATDKTAKRTERIQKQDNATAKAKLARFIDNLPQRLVFIIIVILLLVNTTMSSTGTRLSDEHNVYQSSDVYSEGIANIFSDSWRNRTKLTFSSDDFEQKVLSLFPEVSNAVAVVPIAGRELAVTLYFTKPLLRLVDPQEKTIGIVGEQGTFITSDNQLLQNEELQQLPMLRLLESPEFAKGSQLLTSTETDLVRVLLDEFDGTSAARPKVSSILFDVQRREMQVRFEDREFFARLTPERDSREQIGSLVATIQQLSRDNNLPKEYIDVRVDGRVFVK
jgi:hypothetical protein